MWRGGFRGSWAGRVGGWLAAGALVMTAAAQQQRQQPAAKSAPGAKAVSPAAGGGVVSGRVTVPAGQRLPETVVYLESTDHTFAFEPPAQPLIVSQQGAKFLPSLIVVPVGSRVDFRNDEPKLVEHNVFSTSEPKRFDLGLYKPAEPVEPVLFDQPGAVRLRCSIHRYMDGVVYVTPTPYFAVVGKDGTFAIKGVRPGAYKLKTWQRNQRYPEHESAVTVAAGTPAQVNVGLVRK